MNRLDFIVALPEIVLLAGACALMIVDLFVKGDSRRASFVMAQFVLLACAAATTFVMLGFMTVGDEGALGFPVIYAFHGLYVADLMAHVLKLAAYGAVSLALVYSRQYLLDRGLLRGEYLTLLLFALLGMMVMMSASSFLTVYLGLELLSLCLYALVALNRDSAASTEAAMKYFVLGALASGMLLYGMSMIYGATGTLTITEVAKQIALVSRDGTQQAFLVFGLVFMVSGIAFKLGVVPFHMWIPDVYHGATTAVTLVIGSGGRRRRSTRWCLQPTGCAAIPASRALRGCTQPPSAVMPAPPRTVASTTTTTSARPAMMRLRIGNCSRRGCAS